MDKETLEKKEKLKSVLNEATRLVFFETCSNPLCDIVDVKKVVEAVRGFNKKIIIGIDNTFMTPYILVQYIKSSML